MDRFIHFAVAAGQSALDDSGFKITDENAERVGVQVGVGLGGLPAIEKYHDTYKERGVRKITPFFIPMVIANLASGQISIHTGAKGPNTCVVTACATGTHSIGDAARLIQYGDADVMMPGGLSLSSHLFVLEGFTPQGLSTRNDDLRVRVVHLIRTVMGLLLERVVGWSCLRSMNLPKTGAQKFTANLRDMP